MSTITAAPYPTMSLPELQAELAAWDRMLVRSLHWNKECREVILEAREKCVGEIEGRKRVGRAA